MTSTIPEKIAALRARLLDPNRPGGAVLVVYPPEEELVFRAEYDLLLHELEAKHLPVEVLDFRTMVFETLEAKGLLQKTFQMDAAGSRELRPSLAGMVQREVQQRLLAAAQAHPDAIVCCKHSAALFPWVSFSALLEQLESGLAAPLVVPFPGTENGAILHFLNAKDGYNYRAARI